MNKMLSLVVLAAALSGCANQNSIERIENLPNDANTSSILLIDAKQRAIYATTREPSPPRQSENATSGAASTGDATAGQRASYPVYCAEPSPDALSVISANASGSISYEQIAALSGSVSSVETGSELGVRTASIQVLRDIMFRECEAYVNHANEDVAFMTEHRRMQSTLVSVFALEQLGNLIKAPAAAPAMAPPKTPDVEALKKDAADKKAASDKAAAQVTTDQKALAALKKPDASATDAIQAKYKSDVTKATDKLDAAKKDAATKLAASKAAADALAKATTDSLTKIAKDDSKPEGEKIPSSDKPTGAGTAKSTGDVAAVAQAMQAVVKQSLTLSYTRELCTSVLESFYRKIEGTSGVEPDPLTASCMLYLAATIAVLSDELKKGTTGDESPDATPLELIGNVEVSSQLRRMLGQKAGSDATPPGSKK